MNKRGQFFLIAALVIAGIIITLSAVHITTQTPIREETTLYDLSKEIDYESSQLIDYGVYQENTMRQRGESILSFVRNYSAANPDTDILLAYGNCEALTVLYYNHTSSGFLGIVAGGGPISLPQEVIMPSTPEYDINLECDRATVTLGPGRVMEFELKSGENFFIVLKKQIGEEVIVAQE